MSSEPRLSSPSPLWQRFTLSEEDRRCHPKASPWSGGHRWFASTNVIDLQNYRSPADKERIRRVLLGQERGVSDHRGLRQSYP
jgi:hypothetical protein